MPPSHYTHTHTKLVLFTPCNVFVKLTNKWEKMRFSYIVVKLFRETCEMSVETLGNLTGEHIDQAVQISWNSPVSISYIYIYPSRCTWEERGKRSSLRIIVLSIYLYITAHVYFRMYLSVYACVHASVSCTIRQIVSNDNLFIS